jgi:hypothetical protein
VLSWAMPKGPPTKLREARLAMHVEDHFLEYALFDGAIDLETMAQASIACIGATKEGTGRSGYSSGHFRNATAQAFPLSSGNSRQSKVIHSQPQHRDRTVSLAKTMCLLQCVLCVEGQNNSYHYGYESGSGNTLCLIVNNFSNTRCCCAVPGRMCEESRRSHSSLSN